MPAAHRLDPAIAQLIIQLARGDAARDFKAAMAAQANRSPAKETQPCEIRASTG